MFENEALTLSTLQFFVQFLEVFQDLDYLKAASYGSTESMNCSGELLILYPVKVKIIMLEGDNLGFCIYCGVFS